jgi:hypothetical protein
MVTLQQVEVAKKSIEKYSFSHAFDEEYEYFSQIWSGCFLEERRSTVGSFV